MVYTLAAGSGMLLAAFLEHFIRPSKGDIGIIFVPCIVAALLAIPAAYSQGVRDGRRHPSN
jgi:hypothetical protein